MRLEALKEFCKENSVAFKINEPMSCHTSFKIGGAADIFISVRSPGELSAVFKKCGELDIPRLVIGKGSNLLVSDLGVEGAVISLLNMNGISVNGEEIICGAGAALSDVCRAALDNSLAGLEFAYGIPGRIRRTDTTEPSAPGRPGPWGRRPRSRRYRRSTRGYRQCRYSAPP